MRRNSWDRPTDEELLDYFEEEGPPQEYPMKEINEAKGKRRFSIGEKVSITEPLKPLFEFNHPGKSLGPYEILDIREVACDEVGPVAHTQQLIINFPNSRGELERKSFSGAFFS